MDWSGCISEDVRSVRDVREVKIAYQPENAINNSMWTTHNGTHVHVSCSNPSLIHRKMFMYKSKGGEMGKRKLAFHDKYVACVPVSLKEAIKQQHPAICF